MQEKRKILMVASEVVPFAKTGGLADVCGALPKALQELGHDVRLLMPLYKQVDVKKHRIRRAAALKNLPLKIGSDEIHIDFRTGKSKRTFWIMTSSTIAMNFMWIRKPGMIILTMTGVLSRSAEPLSPCAKAWIGFRM